MRRILIILFCLAGFAGSSATVNYTVTATTVGTVAGGELDDILTAAITDANGGDDVFIYLNASGLIQITAALPVITITQGSITIDKAIGSSSPQGIQFAAAANDPTVTYGITISGNSVSSAVSIKYVSILDFNEYYSPPTFIPRGGIELDYDNNVTINHCVFDNNTVGINFHVSDDLEMNDNTVNIPSGGIGFAYNNSPNINSNQNNIAIKNNTFGDPTFTVLGNTAIALDNYLDLDETTVTIEDNHLYNLYFGIVASNNHWLIGSAVNIDPLFTPHIIDNTFDNISTGILMGRPLKYWRIEDNDFVNTTSASERATDIYISCGAGAGNICGIDFIETNSFGLSTVNTGNTFVGPLTQSAIRTQDDLEAGVNIIGLDIQTTGGLGSITTQPGKYSIIRENKIGHGHPINLVYSAGASAGNTGILAPTINNSALTLGGNVDIDFSLPGFVSTQLNCEVDFYLSNSSGHLLDYLGHYLVTSSAASYTTTLIPPGSVSLTYGDRLACTVTGYGNTGGVVRGTSEVDYFEPGPPPCCYPEFLAFVNGLVRCPSPLMPPPDPREEIIYGTTCLGTAISFNMGAFTCPTGTLSYNWDFGDGYTTSGTTASHTYASTGTYTLTISYSNGSAPYCYDEGTATKQFVITVTDDCCPTVTQQIDIDDVVSPEGKHCVGNTIQFNLDKTSNCLFDSQLGNIDWTLSNGISQSNTDGFSYTFTQPGTYTVQGSVDLPFGCETYTYSATIEIEECFEITCADCVGSFAPEPGKYVFSVWVREDVPAAVTTYYHKIEASVTTNCPTCSPTAVTTSFIPDASSPIIDGWQKVEGTFLVPAGTTSVKIMLDNGSDNDAYFDDIRIHPFNSSSKTYVYDPITLRLSAELDENNYATFYEYDEEGALVRVKKETERGIKTIKEARNNIQKN